MELETDELPDGITKVRLRGAFNVTGVAQVDRMLASFDTSKKRLLVDLTGVLFIASMGIRSLLNVAKTVSGANGRIVLFGASPLVMQVLETTGTDSFVPIRDSIEDAIALLIAP